MFVCPQRVSVVATLTSMSLNNSGGEKSLGIAGVVAGDFRPIVIYFGYIIIL